MAPCPRDTGAKRRRRGRIPPASSTTGRESGLGTRTRRSWTGRERSESSPPIARPGTSPLDRKSTRLNSSHVKISYAVFCLKKKKKTKYPIILHNKYKKHKK